MTIVDEDLYFASLKSGMSRQEAVARARVDKATSVGAVPPKRPRVSRSLLVLLIASLSVSVANLVLVLVLFLRV